MWLQMMVVFQPDAQTHSINTDNAYFGLSCVWFIYSMVNPLPWDLGHVLITTCSAASGPAMQLGLRSGP